MKNALKIPFGKDEIELTRAMGRDIQDIYLSTITDPDLLRKYIDAILSYFIMNCLPAWVD